MNTEAATHSSRLRPFRGALLLLGAFLLLGSTGCGNDHATPPDGLPPVDETPPAAVADLRVAVEADTAVVLRWTAPGDDGSTGRATLYDARSAPAAIDEASWSAANQLDGEPDPSDAGVEERFVVPGISLGTNLHHKTEPQPGKSLYFALKSIDDAGNVSAISNVVLLDRDPPSTVADLTAAAAGDQSIELAWTAPSDNGPLGRGSSYDIRYLTGVISNQDWENATPVADPPVPANAGSRQTHTVSGLARSTTYHFIIRTFDEAGNRSPLSNIASATTGVPAGGSWWDGFASDAPNGKVSALYVRDGELVIGGSFDQVGATAANTIAAWDGSGWSTFGAGFTRFLPFAQIQTIAEYNGELIAGGSFDHSGTTSIINVARWTGSEWLPLRGGVDVSAICLAPFLGDLYVGGFFYSVDGQDVNSIARWDGAAWHSLEWATIAGSGVRALGVQAGELIAGGSFRRAANILANNVAAWDGESWRPLGEGLSGGDPVTLVNALTVYDGDLIAGGQFTSSGATPVSGVARWDGVSWSSVGTSPPQQVFALAVYNGDLIAGGDFTSAGGQAANHLARWDGTAWEPLGGGVTGGTFTTVQALAVYNGSLYVGGEFEIAGQVSSPNLARWDDR